MLGGRRGWRAVVLGHVTACQNLLLRFPQRDQTYFNWRKALGEKFVKGFKLWIAAGAAAAMECASAHAGELWQGARSGMTIEEVQIAVPSAAQPAGPMNLDTDYGDKRALSKLRTEAVPVGGFHATALFYFADDKLFFVKVAVDGDVMPALTSKYGAPVCDDRKKCTFTKDGLRVEAKSYSGSTYLTYLDAVSDGL